MSPFQQGNPDCHNLNAPKVLLGANRLFTLDLYCKARLQSSQCFGDEAVPGGLLYFAKFVSNPSHIMAAPPLSCPSATQPLKTIFYPIPSCDSLR